MRCGKILVKGEAEEIAVSPKPKSRQRHGKRSNPYSTRGLDKFKSVYAELSARREYIAEKTGAPEALVRFAYSKNGWIPVVVRGIDVTGTKNSGAGAAGVSILGPVVKNNGQDGELRKEDAENRMNGLSKSISICVFDESSHSLVMPWSRILKTTSFGLFGLSAMWVKRSAFPAAAAMAVVMAVGGVMCMKKFLLSGVSYFATLFRNPRNPKASQNGGGAEAVAEQRDIDKFSRSIPRTGLTVSAPSSPVRAHVQRTLFSATASPRVVKPKVINLELKRLHHQSKAKKFRRFVSMDNRPSGPVREDSFYRRTRPAMTYNSSVDATAMIITLLCLVFFGRLCAIFFTCACWYLLPMLGKNSETTRGMSRNNNSRIVDQQSSENRKKAIRDGLVQRKHNREG